MHSGKPAAVNFSVTVPAELRSLRILTGLVRRCLVDGVGLLPRDEDYIHIQLAIREACTNVIRHAYQDRPVGALRLRLDLFEGGVSIEIEDEGKPMPAGKFEGAEMPEVKDLAEGGYGLSLIYQLMDHVQYGTAENGANHVRMLRSFRKAA
jgi:serine/threonine-protein kinase RsbW